MIANFPGFLYRRQGGRYIPLDDPDHKDAVIYYEATIDTVRHRLCLFTPNVREAKARLASMFERGGVSDYERFLHKLIQQGKKAEKELSRLLRDAPRRKKAD